ncbi:hypothetical protein Scep_000085 [Stephania cephalantha]|uniref:Exosome complex exonuclease RRP44 n=1 Tax=Stephania cephalantha TaxID=152367 RepID=A0AAP0L9L2_9MAGN
MLPSEFVVGKTNKSFFAKTKEGRVLKVLREHYLRSDIYCGASACKACNSSVARLSSDASTIIIVDSNVVLHQIDLLENPAINDVVVLSTVREEVKNKNLSVYNRLRALCSNSLRRFYVFINEHHKDTYVKPMVGESSNDRNDRAIRVATDWYQTHLGGKARVLLITNDKENKRKALEDGISAETVETYVKSLGQPNLLDLVVQPTSEDISMEEVEVTRPSKRKVIYNEHKPLSEITSGLHRGIYHQGRLRINRYNPFEAYVGSESIGDEIIIHGRVNMNRAFDGDIVAVELLPKDQWNSEKSLSIAEDEDEVEEDVHLAPSSADDAPRNLNAVQAPNQSRPSGRVVGIIKRNWHSYCGSLEPMPLPAGHGGVVYALFVSKDRRIPKIRVKTRQLGNLLDKRIIVAADSWDRFLGTLLVIICQISIIAYSVVLIENDIDSRPFSTQVLACLPPLPWSVSSEDLDSSNRQDLRHLRVFSVDPPGCKDIDDALHCTALPNGNFEVGVLLWCNTFNDLLSADICSLRSDVERLAFSVIWEVTPEAEIISTSYTKSVIKSCAALSYVEAQTRMDDSRLMDPVTTDLRNTNKLAKIMRQRRIERGALTLASAEVKFQIDTETLDPLDVGMYQIREANQMVEEFMLAANVSVAEKILKHFPSCSLLRHILISVGGLGLGGLVVHLSMVKIWGEIFVNRIVGWRHPSPTPEMLEPLLRTAASVGLHLDISSSKALADSLDRAVGDDPYFNKLIRILATRCMTQAVYFCSGDLTTPEYHHYGLAAPLYTHFTSPIRRYADVVVHRLLAAALGISKLPPIFQDGPQLTSIADNVHCAPSFTRPSFFSDLNYRHRNAQMASRASIELHTLIFFRKRPTDAEARIVKIRANGFIVFVPKFGIEGPVYLTQRDEKGGEWVVDEEHQEVKKMDGSISYNVLQMVRIHMEVVEPQPNRPKLQLTLV